MLKDKDWTGSPMKRLAITGLMLMIFAAVPALAVVNDAGILNNQGVELYERGSAEEAVYKFYHALEFDPYNPAIYTNLGYAFQALDEHKKAANAFKKALSFDPSNLENHNSLGVSLYNMGEKDRAIAEWEFVLSNDPSNTAAAANLGIVRHPEKADKIVEQTKEALGGEYAASEYDQAIELKTLFGNGKAAFMVGKYDDAIGNFEKIMERKPESKFSHYYAGMAYAYLQMKEPALKNLREYLILESYPPQSQEAYETAKDAYNTLRDGGDVKPVRRSSAMAANSFNLGKKAYNDKDYFKAIKFLSEAYKLKPNSYATNYYLGMSYKEVDDTERAVYHLNKCLFAGPEYRSKEDARKIAEVLKKLVD